MTVLLCVLLAAAEGGPAANIEESGLRQLLGIHRVYVDRLTGGETAAQMRELLISSLENAKLFAITENQERADAILRGGAFGIGLLQVGGEGRIKSALDVAALNGALRMAARADRFAWLLNCSAATLCRNSSADADLRPQSATVAAPLMAAAQALS